MLLQKFIPVVALFVIVNLLTVQAANILCYFVLPSLSHQVTFQPIVRELARRGHNLTVITPNPLRDPSLPNLDEIDVQEMSYSIWEKHNISSFGTDEELSSTDLTPMIYAYVEIVETQLSHPRIKDLINNSGNYQFDLLIMEYPHFFTSPLMRIYNTSIIAVSSLPLHLTGATMLGNFEHTSLFPDLNLPYGNKLNFWQKVHSFIHTKMGAYLLQRFRKSFNQLLVKYYRQELVDQIEENVHNVDMVLVNYNPILHVPRPNVPAIIEFNGIHIAPPKELPKDIKLFLDNAKNGAVYISFGSNIKSSALPLRKRRMILDALSELPYQFLWKFEKELKDLPKNVRIMKWTPQQDVLRHPNVKLFVTQGGLQSLDEAMYTKTPVLAIPFFGDQRGNAAKAEERGLGKRLNFATLTKDSFKSAILEVVSDEKYKLRMDEVYDILTDQPMSAVDKTVWWVEYVIRHKGARHMRSPTLDATFIEYYMIDVIGFLLSAVLSLLFFIYMGVKLMIKLAKKRFFGGVDGAKKLKKN